jgi:hypothetical protein
MITTRETVMRVTPPRAAAAPTIAYSPDRHKHTDTDTESCTDTDTEMRRQSARGGAVAERRDRVGRRKCVDSMEGNSETRRRNTESGKEERETDGER